MSLAVRAVKKSRADSRASGLYSAMFVSAAETRKHFRRAIGLLLEKKTKLSKQRAGRIYLLMFLKEFFYKIVG